MIHVPRRPKNTPAKLAAKQKSWTDRWKGKTVGRGDWATKTAKAALKELLEPMAYGKCVYCEGILNAQGHLEVEHYIAKTIARHLAFEWENLFPACPECNGAKSNEDHNGTLLKPDADDPEDYFWVHPEGQLELRPGLSPEQQHRAQETIRICNLQRRQLKKLRRDALKQCGEWLMFIGPDQNEDLLEPDRQYKLAIRHQFRTLGRPDLADEDKRRFESL